MSLITYAADAASENAANIRAAAAHFSIAPNSCASRNGRNTSVFFSH
jgi:hypothetical protein